MNDIEIIGTLGDNNGDITCSMYTARLKYNNSTIIPFNTFEMAINSLKNCDIYCVLVPAAYHNLSSFIMDNKLKISNIYMSPIPPLVFANKDKNIKYENIEKIYLHQATYTLLNDINIDMKCIKICFANSNSEACKMILSDESEKTGVITNKLCADYYKLNIIKILRNEINMPWVEFVRKQEVYE